MPETKDARVQAAITHWAPRFVANGVDMNDFHRTTSRISHWSDWCREWSAAAAEREQLAEEAEAAGRHHSAALHWLAAGIMYHFAKYLNVERPDELKEAHERSVRCYQQAAPYMDPPPERVEIPYGSTRLMGNLRKPLGSTRPPVVLLISGLDSVKEEHRKFEELFLQRGMATLAFDGPGQGEAEFDLPIEPAFEKPVAAVVDFIETRSDLDSTRIGAVGISLGGYYAPRAAAYEPRIRAVAGICGPYDWGECWDELPALTRNAFMYRSGAKDEAEAKEKAQLLTLRAAASEIACPLLIVHGGKDRIIPPSHGRRIVDQAKGDKELHYLPEGNHVCNNMPDHYRPYVADWFAEKLST